MGYGFGNRIAIGRRAITTQAQAEPAPSGIPTATTTIINITVQGVFNINFNKVVPDIWYDDQVETEFQFFNSQWSVINQGNVYTFNTLPNQTVDYIPLTGWNPAGTTITVVA